MADESTPPEEQIDEHTISVINEALKGIAQIVSKELEERKKVLIVLSAIAMDEARTRRRGLEEVSALAMEESRIRKRGLEEVSALAMDESITRKEEVRIRKEGLLESAALAMEETRIRKRGLLEASALAMDESLTRKEEVRIRKKGLEETSALAMEETRIRKEGLLESAALVMDESLTRKEEARIRKEGLLEASALAMEETRIRKDGLLEASALVMDESLTRKEEARIRKEGLLELAAGKEEQNKYETESIAYHLAKRKYEKNEAREQSKIQLTPEQIEEATAKKLDLESSIAAQQEELSQRQAYADILKNGIEQNQSLIDITAQQIAAKQDEISQFETASRVGSRKSKKRGAKELQEATNELGNLNTTESELAGMQEAAKEILNNTNNAIEQLGTSISGAAAELKKTEDQLRNQAKKRDSDDPLKEDKKFLRSVSFIVRQFQEIATGLINIANDIRKIQQQFGINAGVALELKFKNFVQSIGSFFSLGALISSEQIRKAQADFQNEFGGVLTPEAGAKIAEKSVRLGITPEQQAVSRRTFMTQAMGDLSAAEAAESKFIGEFEKSNLTASDAMKAIAQYSELVARNGSRFATSFVRAAIDAKKIGVDLGKVDQIGDNIIGNFEGFLEKQAELGAMGFGFDSNRLAQIAETGDTGELFNELRSQLASTGKDITNLRRSEQLALSEAFGISMSDIQRLAGKTEGSGEKTMESLQEESNKLGSIMVNILEKIAVLLGVAATVLSTVIVGLLSGIEFNTAVGAVRGSGGMGGQIARLGKNTGLGKVVGPALGATVGIGGGTMLGTSMGASGTSSAIGSTIGTILGGGIGFALGGPVGMSIGMGIGGLAGGGITGLVEGDAFGDDVVSRPGYGERKLVTPTATVSLNNQDNVIAYADDMMSSQTNLQLLSKGALAPKASAPSIDLGPLSKKMDGLIAAISAQHITTEVSLNLDGNKVGNAIAKHARSTNIGVNKIQTLYGY